jgi:MoxR-like ATPase
VLFRHARRARAHARRPPPPSAAAARTFEEREAGIAAQLEDLKRAAQEAQAEALAAARAAGAAAAAPAAARPGAAPLRARLDAVVAAMSEGLVERDTEVRLLLLAALAGEHVLFLGPPGTAKSELGRRLSRLAAGAYFERLLTRFSVPEELFGPLSMRALEEDRYVRQTRGYLPEAQVAFIDEIFKANSAILNTLLTLLNERLFDNGASRARVPLLCLVAASNELPESEELDALYDRFLLRRRVSQVSPAGLLEMLSAGGAAARARGAAGGYGAGADGGAAGAAAAAPLLTADDFEATRAAAEALVTVPPAVLNLIADLRAHLQERCEPPVYVSDRRLVKAVALLQVAAYTSGRAAVAPADALLLRHVLWQRPEESERIRDWLLAALASDDGLEQVQYLLSGLFGRACKSLGDASAGEALADEAAALRGALCDRLAELAGAGAGGGLPGVADSLWLGAEEAAAAAAALAPKLDRARGEAEQLLFEVVTLEVRGVVFFEGGFLGAACLSFVFAPPLSCMHLSAPAAAPARPPADCAPPRRRRRRARAAPAQPLGLVPALSARPPARLARWRSAAARSRASWPRSRPRAGPSLCARRRWPRCGRSGRAPFAGRKRRRAWARRSSREHFANQFTARCDILDSDAASG